MKCNGRIIVFVFCLFIINSVDILSSEVQTATQALSDKLETVVQENLTPDQLAAALIHLSFQTSQVNQNLKLDIETLRTRIFSLPKSARNHAKGVYSPIASSPVGRSVTPTPPPSRYKKRGRAQEQSTNSSKTKPRSQSARRKAPLRPTAPTNTAKKGSFFFRNLLRRRNG